MIGASSCHFDPLVRKFLHERWLRHDCLFFTKTQLSNFVVSPREDKPSCRGCKDVMGANRDMLDCLFMLDVFTYYVQGVRNFNCLPLLHFPNDSGSLWRNQLVLLLTIYEWL